MVSRGARVWPAASVASRRTSRAGQARSGFTWSAVTGETPPQSSMPASSSGPRSSERFGGACTWISGGSTRRAAAMAQLQVLGRAGRGPDHGRARLGQEVLDDDLLHVPVAGVRVGDGLQRRQLAGAVVADADQDPGGEGDGELAGRLQGGQPAGRRLVGRAAVGGQPLGQRLEHHPLAGRHRAQRRQLGGVQGAGVGVGEQAGLLQDEAAHRGEVVDRRGVPVRRPATPQRPGSAARAARPG